MEKTLPDQLPQNKPNNTFFTRVNTIIEHDRDLLQVDTLLMYRWEIFEKIGVGVHSQVYCAYDRDLKNCVAIKASADNVPRLRDEAEILRKLSKSKHFCRYIDQRTMFPLMFIVMELKGPCLNEIFQNYGPISLSTVLSIGLQMIAAIQALHDIGYIHSDIKPANFVTGLPPNDLGRIYLIDFSLSKKYTSRSHISPTSEGEAPGTLKYVSPSVHRKFRICKRDDMWGILYTLIDLREELPWSSIEDSSIILNNKVEMTDRLIKQYLGNEFMDYMRHIDMLKFEDKPDYEKLRSYFTALAEKQSIEITSKYEWEINPKKIWRLSVKNPCSSKLE